MSLSPSQSRTRPELVAYFGLVFLLSWGIEVPLALSARGVIDLRVPFALHYLAPFGPFAAAVIVTLAARGVSGLGKLLGGLVKWKVGRTYALFAVVSPVVVFAGIVLVTAILQGSWPDLALLGQVDYLPYIGAAPALALWMLTFGMGEEVGWRGFALPRLQKGRTASSASLLLGAFWATWHLPALFYRDTYLEMGLVVIPMLITIAVVGSIVYTWLYNGTQGSLLMLVVFHGLFDFFSVWPAGIIGPGVVMTVLMVFWAVRVYRLYGPVNLAPEAKIVL
ncbi:MAG TPA: CPBP family intramembrane glutamic endopeptidase [Anaerolineales bacterium]|nr:CPBP family intramembrane glutamic endopeptidase [Anaerolineales bacterium]